MSISGQTGGGSTITCSAGTVPSLGGAVTFAILMSVGTSGNCGMIATQTSGSADIRSMQMDTGHLYASNDFTAGFGSSLHSPATMRWYAMTKPAGAAHYRYHYAAYASSGSLTWSHGETVSAANQADVAGTLGKIILFSGQGSYSLSDLTTVVAVAGWNSTLSDATIEATCLRSTQALLDASPSFCYHFPNATATNTVSDLSGHGANESSRAGTFSAGSDPTNYSFTLSGGFKAHRMMALFM